VEAFVERLKALANFPSQRVGYISNTPLSETSSVPPGLLPVKHCVELALYSAYVKDVDPLSLLVIAPVGSGKTELLKAYAINRGVTFYNDFTSYGLYQLLSQIQAGLIRHVLVGDFVRLLARGKAVVREIVATLNALIEEGVQNIETFFVHFHSPKPVKAGVIAALTTEEWRIRRKQWIRMGFLSRALPVSYVLAPEDKLRGEGLIYEGEQPFKPIELKLPNETVDVALTQKGKEALKRLGRVLAAVNKDETGFRSHKHVIAMAKASALRERRSEVEEKDISLLKALSVLWLSPYSGDEPSFRIMLTLPAKGSQLVNFLSQLYSPATIYRRLNYLEKLNAIKRVGDEWQPNL
jgi:DNA-binding PadR family transcriptional regulator